MQNAQKTNASKSRSTSGVSTLFNLRNLNDRLISAKYTSFVFHFASSFLLFSKIVFIKHSP